MAKPSEMLNGKSLAGNARTWLVVSDATVADRSSGGHFSTSYLVENEAGESAFLKAMDYTDAFQAQDIPRELENLTKTYNFERDLLEICAGKNLNRIVRILDQGQTKVTECGDYPINDVNFLVFELANGDVSNQVDLSMQMETTVSLAILHHISVGLQQLHGEGITHHDVRPSNVLKFENDLAKLADLGRAGSTSIVSPHDQMNVAGFIPYAPPETVYCLDPGQLSNFEWRKSGDLFLLGSMVFFMFAGQMLMPQVQSRMNIAHTYERWGGSYVDVLPYYRKAFAETLVAFQETLPSWLKEEITRTIAQLSEPDPFRRGHPKNVNSNTSQYGLQQYISMFNRLTKEASWKQGRK